MNTAPLLVLIVDPNEKARKALGALLARQGYRPLLAAGGKEGLILAWQELPQVIIFEPTLPDLSGEEFIRRLRRDHRTTNTPLIAFAYRPPAETMLACLEAGCNHFLTKERENLPTLLELVREALQEAPFAQGSAEEAPPQGHLIAFLAAKGGVGTSSLCIHTAAALGLEYEERVAVVDLALPLGTLLEITGPSRPKDWTITQASQTPAHQLTPAFLAEHLTEADGWGLMLLPAPRTPDESRALRAEAIPLVIERLRHAYSTVIVDLGRSFSRITLDVLEAASQIVLVLTHDEITVAKTKTVLDYLQEERKIPKERIYPVLNRPTELEGMTRSAVEQALGTPISSAMTYLREHMSLTHTTHTPLTVKYPDDASAFEIRKIAREVLQGAREALT